MQQPADRPVPRRSLEDVSAYVLIATVVIAAFIILPASTIPLGAVKAFVLAGGALLSFALYVLARLSRGNVILPPFLLVGALFLPVLAYALSVAFSGAPFALGVWGTMLETDTFGFMLVVTVLGALAALVIRRIGHYRAFLRVLAWAFDVLVLLELLTLIVGRFSAAVSPLFPIVGSSAGLTAVLGLGVVSTLVALRFLSLSSRSRGALIGSGVVALFLLAVSGLQVVWILVALVSLGLFVEVVMQRVPKASDADLDDVEGPIEEPLEDAGTNRPILLPLATLVASLFFIISGAQGGVLADALRVNAFSVTPSWQSTFSIARGVYAAAPVFGSGPGTFGIDWLKYRDASLNATAFWNVGFTSGIGFIPTSFVTTGAVGIAAWVVFLTLFIGCGLWTLVRRAPQDPFMRFVAILSFISALYLFALAAFSSPGAFALALAFVFAGVFGSSVRFATGSRQWGVIFSRSPRLGFVIVFVLTLLLLASVAVAYTLTGRAIALTNLSNANAAFSAGDLGAAERAVGRSITLAPSPTAYELKAGVALARLGEIAASSTMPAADARAAFQSVLSSGINAALTATSLAPSDYQAWAVLGNLYARAVPLGVSGAYENAKAAYDKAKALDPTDPQILYVIAQLDIANKDIKAAESDLGAAIELKQDYTDAIILLSELEVQDGNVKDALNAALAAAYFTPNDPSILFRVGVLYAATGDLAAAAAALSAAVSANPQFANARYFLAAVYAKQGDLQDALAQVKAIAALSGDNAKAVASLKDALQAGKDPFPKNLLSIPSAPVK